MHNPLRMGSQAVFGRALSLALQLAQFAVVARLLPPETMGAFASGWALWLLLAGFAEFGISATSVIAYETGRNLDRTARASLAGAFSLATAATIVGLVLAGFLYQQTAQIAVLALLPWFIVVRIKGVAVALLQIQLRITRIVGAEIAGRVVALLLTLAIFVLASSPGDTQLLLLAAAALLAGELVTLVGVFWGSLPHFQPIHRPDWSAGVGLIRRAAPLGVTSTVSFLHGRADQVILAWLSNPFSVASYAVVYRINEGLLALANAAGSVTLPMLVRGGKHHQSDVADTAFRIAAAAASIVGIIVMALAPQIVTLIGGAVYESAAGAARILAVAMVASLMNMVAAQVVIVRGRSARLIVPAVVITILNVGLTIALVPSFGFEGAAAATALTESLGFVTVYLIARKALTGFAPVSAFLIPSTAFMASSLAWIAIEPSGYTVYAASLSVACGALVSRQLFLGLNRWRRLTVA